MGVCFPASLTCDRCLATATGKVVIHRLHPMPALNIVFPSGWSCSTLPDSLEIYTRCDRCPVDSTSLAPPPPKHNFPSEYDTVPTMAVPKKAPRPSRKPPRS